MRSISDLPLTFLFLNELLYFYIPSTLPFLTIYVCCNLHIENALSSSVLKDALPIGGGTTQLVSRRLLGDWIDTCTFPPFSRREII